MNAPLLPGILSTADPRQEPRPPPDEQGAQRCLWDSRFGTMLIEVRDGAAYVNGQRVEPFVAAARARG